MKPLTKHLNVKSIFLVTLCCIATCLMAASPPLESKKQSAVQDQQGRSLSNRWQGLDPNKLVLRSRSVLIADNSGREIFGKEASTASPIASITKLMTAMVVLDLDQPLDEIITITDSDHDQLRMTRSRLKSGAKLTRRQLLMLTLMSSENRAASALANAYPGGKLNFIKTMNWKARTLAMANTLFRDPTGLDAGNIATAKDLAIMVKAAYEYPLIRQATTTVSIEVTPYGERRDVLRYHNTNRLVQYKTWAIELSKTGYLSEAGRCLVMQTRISDEKLTLVLLNAKGKLTPIEDSRKIRQWIESGMKERDYKQNKRPIASDSKV